MDDFLPFFKRASLNSARHGVMGKKENIFFRIYHDADNIAYVGVVNAKGETVSPDYHLYNGDTFHVLRSMDSIRKERQMAISWGEADQRICLKEYPYLLYQLLRCDNLQSADGEHIAVSAETAVLQLVLDRKDGYVASSFSIKTKDVETSQFCFLTDVFVLAGNTIYPIQSVGENYRNLELFQISFPEHFLEKYLSVFFSCVENAVPVYEDYTLYYSSNDVHTVPTIIFEKVEEDMSLYLRVAQMLPHSDLEFFQEFDLIYLANLSVERQIVLRRIVQQPNADSMALLRKHIVQNAPSKAEAKQVFQGDDFFIIPQNVAGTFLLQTLPSLVKEFQLLGAERLKDYKVKPITPKLKVSLGSGIDFLEGEASLELDGESFSLKNFITQYRKQKYISLSDGNRAIIDNDYVKRLERIFKQQKGDNPVRVSFFDLPEVESMLEERMKGEAFEVHHKVFEGFNTLASQQMRFPQVNANLRNYQKEGVKWINYLYENKLGGCLADDMGLGKTLQTIAMLTRIYPKIKGVTLIVMPKSLVFNWQSELAKFAPSLSVYTYYGTQRNMDEAMSHQVVLTTYAMVRNDVKDFCEQKFHYVILDESQNIKNVSSQTTQAITLLHAKHRLALSGTPIENNLTELYSLFRFLNPAMFGSLEEFNSQYTYPIQKDNDKDVMNALRRKIYPFLLRRLKKDVLKELPDRTEQMLYVEMEKEHAEYYNERRGFYQHYIQDAINKDGVQKSQFVMFQALNELRRIASVPESMTDGRILSPKIDTLMEMLTEAVCNNHKVVVFFNYIAGIELVSERLDQAGVDFACMTGSTHDRKGVVERFQNNPQCKVLLMTLKTGGVGLNLTAADTVFIFEPWWNKAAEEQAINRLHRFGQKAKVLCYSLITRNSIEEKICLLQQQKAELFAGLIGSDASSTKLLSEEDIKFILS